VQLGRPAGAGAARRRIAAACALLAAGTPMSSRADGGATTQIEATGLAYGEQGRTGIFEPTVRATRLFSNGQTLSAQLGIDAMTGASPTGAMPSSKIQTVTSPSGTVTTIRPGQLPVRTFKDTRYALDLEWTRPLGLATPTLAGHASRETDYQSLGLSGQVAVDLFRKLTTVTVAAGVNHDGVFPVIAADSTAATPTGEEGRQETRHAPTRAKDVTSELVGVTQVLSRRWLASVNVSRTLERGYLTEPYKVVTLLDAAGEPDGAIPENRPGTRDRRDVLASSAYHLSRDVVYASYRYYWDDWGVRSNTYDLKYRRELGGDRFLQPHVRFYAQSPAAFYRYGVIHGPPPPEFVTSDGRLGPLRGLTLGATYGFHPSGWPGELTIRAEFMRQWGNGHPPDALGVQRQFDLFPAVNIGSVLVGYTVEL
jgi:hypothetical protein